MFQTEAKIQCRTRPTTATITVMTPSPQDSDYCSAQSRLRDIKAKAKLAQKQYLSVMSNVNNLRKSIDVCKLQTCQKRLYFMKNYETKKIKMHKNELDQQRRLSVQSSQTESRKKSRILKMNSDLQHLVIKSQQEKMREYLCHRNSYDKNKIRAMKKENERQFLTSAQQKYQRIKEQQTIFSQHKSKRSDYSAFRARKNYIQKIQQEQKLISVYHKILDDFQENGDIIVTPQKNTQEKGFFITNKSQFTI